MSDDKKAPLTGKDFKNGPIEFKFTSSQSGAFPFYAKEMEFNGTKVMKYGYNVASLQHEADVMFLNEAPQKLIVASGCKAGDTVTMELRSIQKADGDTITLWFLNDKSLNDIMNDAPQGTPPPPVSTSLNAETSQNAVNTANTMGVGLGDSMKTLMNQLIVARSAIDDAQAQVNKLIPILGSLEVQKELSKPPVPAEAPAPTPPIGEVELGEDGLPF